MNDGALLLILAIPAGFAFAFGIWAGLGYPGLYDKYDRTGKAPRESPLRWLLRGGRRPLTSESGRQEEEREEVEEDGGTRETSRPSFARGRRFRR